MQPPRLSNAVIVGGGPAGLAPLVRAARAGQLPALAAAGLVVVEKGATPGAGSIGSYAIGSDTLADSFLDCLQDGAEPRLVALRTHPAALALRAYAGGATPLPLAGAFLAVLGRTMQAAIAAAGGTVLLQAEALQTQRGPDGSWLTRVRHAGGDSILAARHVVLATGAVQCRARLEIEPVAGEPLLPRHAARLLLSDEILQAGGAERVLRHLAGKADPKVAIVGGSHSALAVANLLLRHLPGLRFGPGSVSVLHRRALRVFYPSAEAARAEGYEDFTPEDICPVTGAVFRLAGFRLETRELVMHALGIGGRPPERRLRLHRLAAGTDRRALALLEDADLVVASLGYRPRALPVLDADGTEIPLAATGPGAPPLVDGASRVLDSARHPVPGLFGIGLAAGFVPQGRLGGEPSFVGQTNGLWLWQNDVGANLVTALLREASGRVAA
ncbi:Aminotransferase DegT [Rhodovastum atsumiense]|uniref:Aminotransferase DegT n=1 Tax=Rhodovastum atsumiense TaxID=504468 RepID=A0A5M6IZU3_9PROT|nr:FAD-dependent oxidoreductase [Rhodovastum atsumiense]KAA5612868.1 aminotransferase DegT [Rhodovastum atsumiense]CAH2601061.1 Aminotransferase DegT [Rhodovastum atsumiense]